MVSIRVKDEAPQPCYSQTNTDSQVSMQLTTLTPPPYLSNIVSYLKDNEAELWQWFSTHRVDSQRMDSARLHLLKTTYRIEKTTHPRLYELAESISARLGIEGTITFYQAQEATQLNAMLSFIPGEPHVIFFGPLLDTFDDSELEIIIAHELSHFLMWTQDEQQFYTAEQVLNAIAGDQQASACHAESARLFSLFTEVYCDRGALHVSGNLDRAISTLLRVGTGLKAIDAQSFLKQSEEILQRDQAGSDSLSHPASYLRARALQLWHEQTVSAEEAIASLIRGPLTFLTMDLLERQTLEGHTRTFLDHFLAPAWFATEAVVAHAQLFIPGFRPIAPDLSQAELAEWLLRGDEKLYDYFCYLMLDFIAVDRELEEMPLAQALRWSRWLGIEARFAELAIKELKLTKTRFNTIRKQTEVILDAASARQEKQP
ncbi:MAG: hypothetical protein CME36_16605 [unclassified Hahellaceae]|nr:hypothetical protein [Hahellaceae bacterium]